MKIIQTKTFRWLVWAIFFVYIGVLFNLVFLSSFYGRTSVSELRYANMNLVPFKTILNYLKVWSRMPNLAITNILGNIAAFVPFGALLPLLIRDQRSVIKIFFFSSIVSVSIEVIQGYFGVGVLDIDDVILNVLGGILGYLMFKLVYYIYGRGL